jgi:hypothetical protein
VNDADTAPFECPLAVREFERFGSELESAAIGRVTAADAAEADLNSSGREGFLSCFNCCKNTRSKRKQKISKP